MYEIVKIKPDDFEEVIDLLELFENEEIDRKQWEILFFPVCKKLQNDFFGFGLLHNSKFVGVIMCIQSLRNINNKSCKICNISSWIMHPDYRGSTMSLKLLNAVLDMKDFSFLNLTLSKDLQPYYIKKLKFSINTHKYHTLLKFPSIINRNILINDSSIRSYLSGADVCIYDDHQLPSVYHVLYKHNDIHIYSIIKPTLYSSYVLNNSAIIYFLTKAWFKIFNKDFFPPKIKLGLVHYTNKPSQFGASIHLYSSHICKRINVLGLSISDSYPLRKNIFKIKNHLSQAGLYKSEYLNQSDLDTLYSELIFLNLSH